MLFKMMVTTVLVMSGSAAIAATGSNCEQLRERAAESTERAAYAKNAWLNREIVCEADLDRPRCFDYLRNDYKDARLSLMQAKKNLKEARCTDEL